MRILLINPIQPVQPIVIPNLGLGYLASSLRAAGHHPAILDCRKENLPWQDFSRVVAAHRPDIIGFQVFTADLETVRKSAQIIHDTLPGIPVVAGGPHPSGAPEHTLNYLKDVDYGFIGEAESGFPDLIQSIQNDHVSDPGNIAGLIYRENGTVKWNPPRLPKELDSLPLPAWDLINPNHYPHTPHGVAVMKFPVAPVIVTRGCPFPCTFCAAQTVSGKHLRKRSVENVFEEMHLLLNRYGVSDFHIEDDNFTLDRNYVESFCHGILEKFPAIHWALPNGVRLDTLDREILTLMRKSGCYSFAIGIESGNQRILDHMKKKLTLELIREKVALIRETGIRTTGFFILGYPEETEEDILQTIRFAKTLPLTRADFSYFLPLPGTETGNKILQSSRDGDLDWNAFLCYAGQQNYSPPAVPPQRLAALHRKAVLEFYLRPRIMLETLREIRTLDHLKYFWNVGKIFLKG